MAGKPVNLYYLLNGRGRVAGIATGDKTQVAFRAGTNYKFKLF